jgi:hypothetical protein
VKIKLKGDAVILSGKSLVNQALQPGLVKRKLADFKRLAFAASPGTAKRSQGFISRSKRAFT